MDNQQPSPLVRLARNAKLGDGSFWRHPECVNYKVIYTSTTPELLELKYSLCPDMFPSGIYKINLSNVRGRFPNAKPMFGLRSLVDPIFTKYASLSKVEVFKEFDMWDMGLWYLDDGSCQTRRDTSSGGYRIVMSIGNLCHNTLKESVVRQKLRSLIGIDYGSIGLNNSKATENNKSWRMTYNAAKLVLAQAVKHGILLHKFPREWFND